MSAEEIIWGDYDKLADFFVSGKVYKVGRLYNTLFWNKLKLLNAFITYLLTKREGYNAYYADLKGEHTSEYDVKTWIDEVDAYSPLNIQITPEASTTLEEELTLDIRRIKEVLRMYLWPLISNEGLFLDVVVLFDDFMPEQHEIVDLFEGDLHMVISIHEKMRQFYLEKEVEIEGSLKMGIGTFKEVDFYEKYRELTGKNVRLLTLNDFVRNYMLNAPDSENLLKDWSSIRDGYIEKMKKVLSGKPSETTIETTVDEEDILLECSRLKKEAREDYDKGKFIDSVLKSYHSIQLMLQLLIKRRLGKSVRMEEVKNYLDDLKGIYGEDFYYQVVWAKKIRNKVTHERTLDDGTLSEYATIIISLDNLLSKFLLEL